jgi:hypothetical protein
MNRGLKAPNGAWAFLVCPAWIAAALLIPPPERSRPAHRAGTDPPQLRDITGIERSAAPSQGEADLTRLWVAAAVLTGLIFGLWWCQRYRRRPPAIVGPEQWALAEIDRLDQYGSVTPARTEAFHTALSNVLRRYLEMRFHLLASSQTTQELLAAVAQSPVLTPDQQSSLRAFLERCDLAKYAPPAEPPAQGAISAAMAKQFVELCRPSFQRGP